MEISGALKRYFTLNLMQWHRNENFRILPWKEESDPYKIWLSEIIMQQTRVEQGMPYYERFITRYPTVKKLASAQDEEIYRLWQGLGYYNRCRNLLHTARFIVNELNGNFPKEYDEVLKLKGIGAYTAAAIVSFAYNLPYAVVDGNVQRVLARFFGIDQYPDSGEGKRYFQSLAQNLIDTEQPGEYNQSIMDFGATVCKPAQPLCTECVLRKKCYALKREMVSLLPLKKKKSIIKHRYFNYFIFEYKNAIWIQQRTQKDIWHYLHQPYLIEDDKQNAIDHVQNMILEKDVKMRIVYEGESSQKLSHQTIHANFFYVRVNKKINIENQGGLWVELPDLKNYAFPKTIVSFFEKKGYF